MNAPKLRVLLVPESTYWVTGTLAKNFARFNPWIHASVVSGTVIHQLLQEQPKLMENFDLVHFTCPYASKELLPRFRDSVPCVTSHHHATNSESFEHNVDGDAIVVGANEWVEDLRARGSDVEKVFCVPYGVDATLFHPTDEQNKNQLRDRLGIHKDAACIGFFGKNSSDNDGRKGVDVFEAAVSKLNRQVERLAVLIIGPGWEALANSLRASGVDCIWIPYIQDVSDLPRMYQVLDFYWVTSRVEGGPVTLLEAMSTGVCCLTTPVGIAREIVENNCNAVLLQFDDADAFVDKTTALVNDPEERRRLGQNARETILQEMDVSITAPGIKDVYLTAVKNFGRRTGAPIESEINRIVSSIPGNRSAYNVGGDEVPLNGFPRALHKRIRLMEVIVFAEHLLSDPHHRAVAVKMIAKEWAANPSSFLPLRVLLRGLLPYSWVSNVVKFKNKFRRKAELVPN